MIKKLILVIVAAMLFYSCSSNDTRITAQVGYIKDFPNQLVSTVKSYIPSDQIFKGDLYIQLCSDAACTSQTTTKKVLDDTLFSTGSTEAVKVKLNEVTAGQYYARFVVDTEYSKNYGHSYSTDNAFGGFDVTQTADDAQTPTEGNNPISGTTLVTIKSGKTTDMGTKTLGTILFDTISSSPTSEAGLLLVGGTGTNGYRNAVYVIDLTSNSVASPIVLQLDGHDFGGDICGFVKGQDASIVYVIAVGEAGAYVSPFNTTQQSFASKYLRIPHPDYTGGSTEGLSPDKYPYPCKGVSMKKGNDEILNLIHSKDDGTDTTSAPYPMMTARVTNMASGTDGAVLALIDRNYSNVEVANFFFPTNTKTRTISSVGGINISSNGGEIKIKTKIYVDEPSWSSTAEDRTRVNVFNMGDDGNITRDNTQSEIVAGVATATTTCSQSSTKYVIPAMIITQFSDGEKRMFVGNDNDISMNKLDGTLVKSIDTSTYGKLITSFALSPDEKTLYALPACPISGGAHVKTVDLDRHAIVVIDLTSDSSNPTLKMTDKDYDGDGVADGGIEIEFLNLKKNLLDWCDSCSGSIPPTSYSGPQIAAGTSTIFLRATGSESTSSGLGQVADLGMFDTTTGQGLIFRNYNVWIDGPSGKWGYDLSSTGTSDVSTTAFIYVAK